MKKILIFVLAIILSLSFIACDTTSINDTTNTEVNSTRSTTNTQINNNHPVLPEIEEYDYNRLFNNGLILTKSNEGYGYINPVNQVIIDFQYQKATPFQNGGAIVGNNDLYGIIDTLGNYYYPMECDQIFYLKDTYNYLLLIDEDLYFYSLTDLKKTLIGPYYVTTSPSALIENEYFPLSNSEGLKALFDNQGNQLTEFVYSSIRYDSKSGLDLFCAKRDELYGYINNQGQTVIDFQFHSACTFTEFGIAIVSNGNRYALINTEGTLLTTYLYPRLEINDYGYVLGSFGTTNFSEQIIMDSAGNILIDADYKYNYFNMKTENFVFNKRIDTDDFTYFFDYEGNLLFNYEESIVENVNEHFIILREGGLYTVIDFQNNILIEDSSYTFLLNEYSRQDILIEVIYENYPLGTMEVDIYDITGNKITNESYLIPQYFEYEYCNESYLVLWKTDYSAMVLLDNQGNVLFSKLYDFKDVRIFSDNYLLAYKDDNQVILDLSGNIVIDNPSGIYTFHQGYFYYIYSE